MNTLCVLYFEQDGKKFIYPKDLLETATFTIYEEDRCEYQGPLTDDILIARWVKQFGVEKWRWCKLIFVEPYFSGEHENILTNRLRMFDPKNNLWYRDEGRYHAVLIDVAVKEWDLPFEKSEKEILKLSSDTVKILGLAVDRVITEGNSPQRFTPPSTGS